jgi:hypothetical chaperone protein
MPSKAYVERRQYEAMQISEGVLEGRVAAAIRSENQRRTAAMKGGEVYRGLTDRQIEERERNLMRREAVEEAQALYSEQSLATALATAKSLLFGEEAIRANMIAPLEGFYLASPKLFLGSEIEESHLEVFSNVIAAMLSEVRDRAESKVGHALRKVTIGHPVVYTRATGQRGNRQALRIMEDCAKAAGFDEVAFLPEPLAAALNYEMSVKKEELILVVDVGGGTTDCAVVRVRPGAAADSNRADDVLSSAGDRVGGTNMDFHLAWRRVMPHFGKDTKLKDGHELPHTVLIEAISIDNIPAQQRFSASGRTIQGLMAASREPEKLKRLYDLWQQGLQFRLVRSAELAKIDLSATERTTVPLHYVDSELNIPISRDDLRESIASDLSRIGRVAHEAMLGADAVIDKVFITGGASRSPAVQQSVLNALGREIPLIRGDDLGSVTEGLTRYSNDFFGRRAAGNL